MTDNRAPGGGDHRRAMDAMRSAYARAAAAIDSTADPSAAFRLATELREATDHLVGEAAELRARMAARIWETEQMSLAKLAERIGVSKARADQFLKAARAAESEDQEETRDA